jgi:hypothetical protein
MSFIITIYVPEAIVMASDSRQSIIIKRNVPDEATQQAVETINSDFVYKTFLLQKQGVGISTFGESILGKTTIESHMKRFQEEKVKNGDDIFCIAQKLLDFFSHQFPSARTAFHIGGFMKESRKSVPYVYHCQVSRNEIRRLNTKPGTEEVVYGASWGGQGDIIAGILGAPQKIGPDVGIEQNAKAPVVWDAMPIQDAVDFAIYAVKTTIDTIRFQARPKNVGGPIDVLLLTPEENTWIQRKEYRGQNTNLISI